MRVFIAPSSSQLRAAEIRATREALAVSLRRRTPRCYGTWWLAAFHVALFAVVSYSSGSLTLRTDAAIAWGADSPARIIGGEWWRMLTGAALHGSPVHLLLNLSALVVVGPTLERLIGTRAFLMVYVACALGGSALSLAGGTTRVTVGASGAVLGIFGVILALAFPRKPRGAAADGRPSVPVDRRLLDGYIGMAVSAVASTLLFGWLLPHVNNLVHVGGFVMGCFIGWLIGADVESRLPRLRETAAGLLVAVACCVVAVALSGPRRPLYPVLMRVFTTDSTIHVRHAAVLRDKADGQAMRTLIQNEILPALAADREALARIDAVADHERAILEDLRQYIALREESWRERKRALDADVPAAGAGPSEIEAKADAIMRRLLQARL